MIPADKIAALQAALDEATPGPWFAQEPTLLHGPDRGGIVIGDLLAEVYRARDLRAIVRARNLLPDLLAERALLVEIAEAARLVAQWADNVAEYEVPGPLNADLRDVRAALAKTDPELVAAHDERVAAEAVKRVTRFEVIDHRSDRGDNAGRSLVAWPCTVELAYQDGGRTLKVFLTDAAALTEEGGR